MTWYYNPTGTTLDVYDHTGTLVAESVPFPGAWSGTPDRVYQIVLGEVQTAIADDETRYATVAGIDLATGNIVEGTP